MCVNVTKGKEEGSFAFSSDGGEIYGCSGVFFGGAGGIFPEVWIQPWGEACCLDLQAAFTGQWFC